MIVNIGTKRANPNNHTPDADQQFTADELNALVTAINTLKIVHTDNVITGTFTKIQGETVLTLSIDYELLATKLIPAPPDFVCPTLSNVVVTKTGANTASVAFTTNNSSATFKYAVDGGGLVAITTNPFTISGLSAAVHTIAIKAIAPDNTVCTTSNGTVDMSVAPNQFRVGWSATNPFPNMTDQQVITAAVAPVYSQQSTGNVANGGISADFTAMPLNYYPVIDVDAAEAIKQNWYDTSFNNGVIPDSVFRTGFTVAGRTYYVGRNPTSFDTTPSHKVLLT